MSCHVDRLRCCQLRRTVSVINWWPSSGLSAAAETCWDIARYWSKIANLNIHRWGWHNRNFAEIFGIRKLESRAIVLRCLCDLRLVIGTVPACDRQTDGRTHDDSIYSASIASHCKNEDNSPLKAKFNHSSGLLIFPGFFIMHIEQLMKSFLTKASIINNNNNVRLLNCWHTAQLTILTSATRRNTTAATQGSTIYRRVKPAKLPPHTAHSDWINRTGLTSWAFTRWCDRYTSNKVAHYSIYRPRKDERLSWPWLAGYIPK